jgi:hypothetical protein
MYVPLPSLSESERLRSCESVAVDGSFFHDHDKVTNLLQVEHPFDRRSKQDESTSAKWLKQKCLYETLRLGAVVIIGCAVTSHNALHLLHLLLLATLCRCKFNLFKRLRKYKSRKTSSLFVLLLTGSSSHMDYSRKSLFSEQYSGNRCRQHCHSKFRRPSLV